MPINTVETPDCQEPIETIAQTFTAGEIKPEGIYFVLVQDGLITSAFRKLTF